MKQRDTIIETARSIDAMPPLAIELIDMLQSPDAEVHEVAHIVAHDPASAANLLKLANSAAMAPRYPVTEIKQAVLRIGLQRTAQVVLHGVVAEHIAKPIRGYDLKPGALWDFSAASAIATQILAKNNNAEASPQAYTAGLLQDLGKLVLGHFVRVDIEAVRTLAFEQGYSFEQAEREVLGIDHAEVGAVLLESWGISGVIQDAVRWHHEPDAANEQNQSITYFVHVAGHIVNLTGIGGGLDGSQHQLSDAALDFLGIQPKRVEQVIRETLLEFDQLRNLTKHPAGSSEL